MSKAGLKLYVAGGVIVGKGRGSDAEDAVRNSMQEARPTPVMHHADDRRFLAAPRV
ncbi:hypothetical protein [Mesorhizobium sp. M1405]|uniref:hypothetical protein n=1 Tax=Mesorhizobium sp. M1405 TaxID=2957098 RepID=UPI00333DE581